MRADQIYFDFFGRTKLLDKRPVHRLSLLIDSLFLSLCIELAYDGTRELLVAVLGISYLGGLLLAHK